MRGYGYEDQLIREIRQEMARRERLVAGVAPYLGGFALDASGEESTVEDFASRALRRLGMSQAALGVDPVTALECWLAGKRAAADLAAGKRPAFAMDAAGGSFMDRYLASNN